MDVKKFYDSIGGDYDNAKSRLTSDEQLEKFLKRFPAYVDIEGLTTAVNNKDYRTVFDITHTVRGMCLNLELTPLTKSSSALCESVRNGAPAEDIQPLLEKFRKNFDKVKQCLQNG